MSSCQLLWSADRLGVSSSSTSYIRRIWFPSARFRTFVAASVRQVAESSTWSDTATSNLILDKIYALEGLVNELRGRLGQHDGPSFSHSVSSEPQTDTPASSTGSSTENAGMLVTDQRNGARYLDGRFWTRIQEEASEAPANPFMSVADS